MAGSWTQYPNYNPYQAQGGYPSQGVASIQGIHASQHADPPQESYSAQAYAPASGSYHAGGGYPSQGVFPQQQYIQAYYPQQQYGPAQPSYGHPQYPGYPPQPTLQQHPQYAQPQQYPSVQQPQRSVQPTHLGGAKFKPARPSLDTCYNCGSPDHWAQNCPEPKRLNPHGQHVESNFQQRQKQPHRPAIVTRYPVPSHVAAKHPQTPSQNTPMTPFSAQSPSGPHPQAFHNQQSSQRQWQGMQPPTPQSQVPYPGGNFPVSGQTPHGLPTPRNSFSYSPNLQGSPSTPQIAVNAYGYPGVTGHSQSPTIHMPSDHGLNNSQEPTIDQHERKISIASSRKASTDQSVSMRSESDIDDEDDCLQLLDIPDLPKSFDFEDYQKPRLVGKPVPALDHTGSANSSPIRESDAASKEFIISKYLDEASLDDLLVNICQKDQFENWQHDPVFAVIKTESRESSPRKKSRSNSPQSERVFDTTDSHGNGSYDTNTSTEDDGNRTPVYRRDENASPRARDAFDLDPDDLYQEERRPKNPFIRTPGYLPGLGNVPCPPPPPPPPPNGKPPGIAVGYGQHNQSDQNGSTNTVYQSNSGGRSASYNGSQASPTANSSVRKRKVEAADFMDSPEHDRKRQQDDYVPKHRRNQPRVAEAYSRRW